ncbi:dihydroxyacetone kinase family protein [Ruania zhangjianzhongii]|uniref:dihydroxyacetone kinase family protein n=1 Tax=Ruania zhangjianzhongii TaxID=2603206 RepID=UPI0011CBBD4C|nr:dihydroxyacetone kinase family protein [Ruania zhangjianzhongii]
MFVGEGADSIEDVLSGFARANPGTVMVRDGSVVRRNGAPPGQVAVVLGGGGGHYPGFAGWVGAGMADAAVSGQIFSSPSEAQIYRAARAVENGGGVLLASLNYSGDRIHFGAAARRLRAEGVAVEEVVIADDIASRTAPSAADGRGIAGALFVAKVLGAAADEGRSLAEVARVGRRAAARSVTLGAATSGCTLPGDREPLFTVPAGKLAIGLGIHGEPGIEMQTQGTPHALADHLVTALLDHAPEPQQEQERVAVLVNSLGGCSHEELFILYTKIHDGLESRGRAVVSPVVGEYLTSLDMIGASLSVMFLDAELESLWRAPAHTPSFFREAEVSSKQRTVAVERAPAADLADASPESRGLAARVCVAIGHAAEAVRRQEERLGQLDRVGGDGDHGRGMVRGLSSAHDAALAAAESGAGLRSVLAAAGAAWSEKAGGTSGALWGAALAAFATAVDDQRAPTVADIADGLTRALDAVVDLGGARPGDKTMVDAIAPFVDVFTHTPDAMLATTWARAAAAAEAAAEGTADLVAAKGRARIHGQNTLGTPDPGAVSLGLVVRAVESSFEQ